MVKAEKVKPIDMAVMRAKKAELFGQLKELDEKIKDLRYSIRQSATDIDDEAEALLTGQFNPEAAQQREIFAKQLQELSRQKEIVNRAIEFIYDREREENKIELQKRLEATKAVYRAQQDRYYRMCVELSKLTKEMMKTTASVEGQWISTIPLHVVVGLETIDHTDPNSILSMRVRESVRDGYLAEEEFKPMVNYHIDRKSGALSPAQWAKLYSSHERN